MHPSKSRMTTILDLPKEVIQEIFSFLNLHTLRTIQKVCRKWSKASQCTRYLDIDIDWNDSLSNDAFLDLPSKFPLLQYLNFRKYNLMTSLYGDSDDEEHPTLRHIDSDTFWIADLLYKCPQLETFKIRRIHHLPEHEEYMFSNFVQVVTNLISRISLLSIESMDDDPNVDEGVYRNIINLHSFPSVAPMVARNLTSLTLHIRMQPLQSIYDFLNKFEFPNVSRLSLAHFAELPHEIRWPEFVSHIDRLFPRIQELEIQHSFADITTVLPKDLKSFRWIIWARVGAAVPQVSLIHILDGQPHLKLLDISQFQNPYVPLIDNIQHTVYPCLENLKIDVAIEGLHRFPNLSVLTIQYILPGKLESFLDNLRRYCPMIERLGLEDLDTFEISSLRNRRNAVDPWFPRLKKLSLSAKICDYQSLASFMTVHKQLEDFEVPYTEIVGSDGDFDVRYPALTSLRRFRISKTRRVEEARALIQLSCQCRQLNHFEENDRLSNNGIRDYCPLSMNFHQFWPCLKYLEYNNIVLAEHLASWAENKNWPRQLETLKIRVLNTIDTWTSLVHMLETHHERLKSCTIKWHKAKDGNLDGMEREKVDAICEEWAVPDLDDEMEDWKAKIKSSAASELALIIYCLLQKLDISDDTNFVESHHILPFILNRIPGLKRCSNLYIHYEKV